MKEKIQRALPILADVLLLIGIPLVLWLLNLIRSPWKLGIITVILALGFAVRRTRPEFIRGVLEAGRRGIGKIIAFAVFLVLVSVLVAAFFWFRGPVETSQGNITRWEFLGQLVSAARKRTCQNQLTMLAPALMPIPLQTVGAYNRFSLEIDDDAWERMSVSPANMTERKFTEGMIPFVLWITGIELKSVMRIMAGSESSRCEWPDGYYDFFQLKELDDLSQGHPEDVFSIIEKQLSDMVSNAPRK